MYGRVRPRLFFSFFSKSRAQVKSKLFSNFFKAAKAWAQSIKTKPNPSPQYSGPTQLYMQDINN
jgi:hypothetical protein